MFDNRSAPLREKVFSKTSLLRVFGRGTASSPWMNGAPVREELFSVERLEQHAETLAVAQAVTDTAEAVPPLAARLDDNAAVLLAAYRSSAAALEGGHTIVPAAEWLLDNYHLVEEQIREIRQDLPPGYYRQLPKLASGPFAGYPRVFGIAWAFVAHTDSHFDPEILQRFVLAYQRVQPLTIGELWALAITLRIVLVENLRRLASQIVDAHRLRSEADQLADRLVGAGDPATQSAATLLWRFDPSPLPDLFAAQLAKRLRDQDPRVTQGHDWLEDRLRAHNTSIEEVVRNAQQRQGASNMTVRNIITSMRLISDTDWAAVVESISPVDHRLRSCSAFAAMDFQTRNLYRSAIEELARGSGMAEIEVAERALAVAAVRGKDDGEERVRDPGYYLIAGGRRHFEEVVGYRPTLRRRLGRFSISLGIGGYVGSITAVTLVLLLLILAVLRDPATTDWRLIALLAAVGFFPAMDCATALVNRAVTRAFGATVLPGLELADGIPPRFRTLVVVPTLLTSARDVTEQVEQLEVHHLASPSGELSFALLTDWLDADHERSEADDHLVTLAAAAIARLNSDYPSSDGNRFFILHRRRVFNEGEGRWMGWERKRGKLHELNRLLRGATDTTFLEIGDRAPVVPADVRYVIMLDADTRLPQDTVRRLIGKMAHPLNQPRLDRRQRRVIDGYAILQPRITPSLPVGRGGSLHQRVFSSPGGIDPYAAAVSDVYQDLFGEGSYTGKGIYDVDAFKAALEGRVPENSLLSHDLFEGTFARAALASDVEFVEESPARYDVAAKRQHRWARGDWQLLPWIVGRSQADQSAVPPVAFWKMLDNLRRTLLAPMTLPALVVGWLLLPPALALGWTVFIVTTIAVPAVLPVLFALIPGRTGVTARSHFGALASDTRLALTHILLQVTFLADQAWLMGDAIARTLFRLMISHRHLLEWVAAAQARVSPRLTLGGFYRQMAGGVVIGGAAGLAVVTLAPESWLIAMPFVVLWLGAPVLALWISRSPANPGQLAPSTEDAVALRLIARRTWRFFETFVTPADSMLPPDNFQEDPGSALAHRTSPTNMGLYLLSAVAARDFGWAGTVETVERLEATLATMAQLQRFRGHFYNWYETRDRRVLEPAYVSSVDSGNLAGHLIALANACREWTGQPLAGSGMWTGMTDDLHLARDALARLDGADGDEPRHLAAVFATLAAVMSRASGGSRANVEADLLEVETLADRAVELAHVIARRLGADTGADLVFWTAAIGRCAAGHHRDRQDLARSSDALQGRLGAIDTTARGMAVAMDFAFLLDPERRLLSIGYSVSESSLDHNCYDLLASEARLASLFAIAKGDVPARHWFRLGRTATPLGHGAALISWSGSMFEYLMPSLVMRAPAGSLLEQTSTLVVQRQQAYGRSLGIPWGISESAYNARDLEFTYQYSNFGVPGLGLKRGLSENAVIAPYATGLATMVDSRGAVKNYARLAQLGAEGRYGFYEALDFTRTRLPEGARVAVVSTFMAHHQGMTIVAIANTAHPLDEAPAFETSDLEVLAWSAPADLADLAARAETIGPEYERAHRNTEDVWTALHLTEGVPA